MCVDEMCVDEMRVDEICVDELTWHPNRRHRRRLNIAIYPPLLFFSEW
jgi:hypothetical protein